MGELAIVRASEKAEKTLGAKFNIRAFHDAVLELGSVPLPVSRRGSTASSPKAAKTLTRIWTEQAPVAGVADAGFPLATVRGDRFASQRLLCRRSWSVRRRATQVCGRGLRLHGSRGRVAAHSIDEPLRWRAASASFPHRGFSIPGAPKARLTRDPDPAGCPYRETLVTPSRRVPGGLPPVPLGPRQASTAIDLCSVAPDNFLLSAPRFVCAAHRCLATLSMTTAPARR